MISCEGLAAFYPRVLSNTPAASPGQSQPIEIDYSLIDLRSNAIGVGVCRHRCGHDEREPEEMAGAFRIPRIRLK
jgi:hypothetical protein